MIQIIPAILATTSEQYQNDLVKLSNCEALQNGWIHIDFTDNKFVQNQTIGPEIVEKFPVNFRKEAHLMVSNPKDWIEKLVKSGFARVIIHLETEQVGEALDLAISNGLKIGLAIKNETDLEKLTPLLGKIDTILIMSIDPGFQGQPFLVNSLNKAKIAKERWDKRVGLDGGVEDSNIKDIALIGVDFVVVGSYLLRGNVDESLEKLWEVINGQ